MLYFFRYINAGGIDLSKFVIHGGAPLKGTIHADGAKNAAVAILPAALLSEGVVTIEQLPYIDDVIVLKNILNYIGASTDLTLDGTMTIDPKGLNTYIADYDLVSKMRASYYLLGVLLTKFGKAEVALPGGCEIGQRPIDQHIKGIESLGAKVKIEHGMIKAVAPEGGLIGAEIYMDVVSVGATINIMLAAVQAQGNTTIVNAAKEPHIVDVANFLNVLGAKIKGAGTDTIKIKGVPEFKKSNSEYNIIPDQIETGTLMIAAAATRGDVTINHAIPTHMEALTAKLIEAGVEVETGEEYIRVNAVGKTIKRVNIKTLPYPGFPTDLQQPMTSLLTTAQGTSTIVESIFEDRFKHTFELRRMGAMITVEGKVAVVEGVDKLTGANITASDLRAGAALMIAGLMAEGRTTISNVKYIDRGYNKFEKKLAQIGADIIRVED